jgi:AraC-like DNA-binding protein
MGAMQINLREIQVIGQGTKEWIVHRRECPALGSLGIQYAGVTHAAAGYAFCRKNPAIAVIFGSLVGSSKTWVNGRWKHCGAGDVYLTPAGVPHAYHAVRGKKWHVCWVAYEAVRGRQVIPGEQAELKRGHSEGLRDAILGLYHEAHGLNEAGAVHHWAELVDLSARRLIKERQIDERLLRLWDGIDRELGHPWRLGEMAKRVGLSGEQLRHLCQKYFGRSPLKHLTWLRMKRAAFLLERTDEKIATIAETVGYENAFAFSVAFKWMMGVSPLGFSKGLSQKRRGLLLSGG